MQACQYYGPLWVFWCYPYEKMLGYIKKFIHSTKRPEKGFVRGCQITRALPRYELRQAKNMPDECPKKEPVILFFFLVH